MKLSMAFKLFAVFVLASEAAWLRSSSSSDRQHALQTATKDVGDVEDADGDQKSTLFLLHHSFRKSSDVDAHWKATAARDMNKFFNDIHKEGYHFHSFLPTAKAGPFYCLWEAAPGKTKQAMQMFIDNSEVSPASRKEGMSGSMLNTVMLIPASLAGFAGVKRFNFGAKALIQISESDTKRSLLGAKNPDGFYFVKHTFRKSSDVDGHWKATAARDMNKFFNDIHKEGFHFHSFLPTAKAGPFYCLWEAAPGKTKQAMQMFIDNSEASPSSRKEGMSGNMLNTVMHIPASLHGGAIGFKSYDFK